MSEFDLIIDLHKNTERQGPGSEKDTLRALGYIDMSGKKDLNVLDIGCGSGGQTLILAQNIDGHITAVDVFQEFLDELNEKAIVEGLNEKITTLKKSMDDLTFDKESIDIIWSEGAIYNIGFEEGVKQWRKYLKPGGYLSVSEATWITNRRPQEIEDFWIREYPDIDSASNKIRILEDNGYTLVGYFYLPEGSWVTNYYRPLEARFSSFLQRQNHSAMASQIVEEYRSEIELYNRFKEYFSYGFYIARKN